jgi:uncharacterized membrane protein YfcA
MDSPTLIMLVLTILFISTLTRSTFGFGDALIAMPLLSLFIDVQIATPLVQLIASVIAFIIVGQSWRNIDLRITWRLILSSALGIPVGLLLLKMAPEGVVIGLLAALLIGYGLYNLARPQLPQLANQRWAYGFGFVAGILGGAYNTNGPPVIIYGTLRKWSPERFRATLQGYFLPVGLVILLGHALGGLWTRQVWQLFGLSLPIVLAAIFLGARLNRRIPPNRFDRLIYAILVVLGVILLI